MQFVISVMIVVSWKHSNALKIIDSGDHGVIVGERFTKSHFAFVRFSQRNPIISIYNTQIPTASKFSRLFNFEMKPPEFNLELSHNFFVKH